MNYFIQAALISASACSNYAEAKPIYTPITRQYIGCSMSKKTYLDVVKDLKERIIFTSGKE